MAEIHVAKPSRGGRMGLWLVLLLVALAVGAYAWWNGQRDGAATAAADTTTPSGVVAPAPAPAPAADSAGAAMPAPSPDSAVAADTAPGRR